MLKVQTRHAIDPTTARTLDTQQLRDHFHRALQQVLHVLLISQRDVTRPGVVLYLLSNAYPSMVKKRVGTPRATICGMREARCATELSKPPPPMP